MEIKIGDIVVSKETNVQVNNSGIDKDIKEIKIGELKQVYMISKDGKFIWFIDTPFGSGSYAMSKFLKATKYEVKLYDMGIRFKSPESDFEDGDKVITFENLYAKDIDETIEKDTELIIESIIKSEDKNKSIVWFEDKLGSYKISGFKKKIQ